MRVTGRINYFSINMSSLKKKKKVLSVSLQTFDLLQAVVEIEKIWRCGVGTLSVRVKGEYRCLYYYFFLLVPTMQVPLPDFVSVVADRQRASVRNTTSLKFI